MCVHADDTFDDTYLEDDDDGATWTVVRSAPIAPPSSDSRARPTSVDFSSTLTTLAMSGRRSVQICTNGSNDCHTTSSMFALAALKQLSAELRKTSSTAPLTELLKYAVYNIEEAAEYFHKQPLRAKKLLERVRGTYSLLVCRSHSGLTLSLTMDTEMLVDSHQQMSLRRQGQFYAALTIVEWLSGYGEYILEVKEVKNDDEKKRQSTRGQKQQQEDTLVRRVLDFRAVTKPELSVLSGELLCITTCESGEKKQDAYSKYLIITYPNEMV